MGTTVCDIRLQQTSDDVYQVIHERRVTPPATTYATVPLRRRLAGLRAPGPRSKLPLRRSCAISHRLARRSVRARHDPRDRGLDLPQGGHADSRHCRASSRAASSRAAASKSTSSSTRAKCSTRACRGSRPTTCAARTIVCSASAAVRRRDARAAAASRCRRGMATACGDSGAGRVARRRRLRSSSPAPRRAAAGGPAEATRPGPSRTGESGTRIQRRPATCRLPARRRDVRAS